MSRPLSSAVRVLVAALWIVASGTALAAGLTGQAAPDFVLKSLDGTNIRLSEYRGRVVMLAFWASWCGECRAQLEGLADLYERYHEAGFDLLTVSLDREERRAREAASRWEAGYPVLYDAGAVVGRAYEVSATPLAVLIDRDGVVREVFRGYGRGQGEQYLEHIRALLRE